MTHRNIRRCLLGTVFAGGLLAFGGVAANAADTTSGTDGLLSGTQVVAPISIPINLGATSLGLLGDSTASAESGTTPAPAPAATPAPAPTASTSGSDGVASGTQVVAPVTAPVTVGATSVGLIGDSSASTQNSGTTATPVPSSGPAASTSGSDGIASGTQVLAPITAPINLGATSLGLLGDSTASVEGSGTPAGTTGTTTSTAPTTTSGADGILSGTQIVAPVTAPINLGATSLGLIGDSAASVEGSGAGMGGITAPAAPVSTSGADGILSGTQITAPITLPISLGATSVGVVGDSTASVVNPPVISPPVVAPPVVTPPVVNPPAVTPPAVTPPATEPVVNIPDAQMPAAQPAAGSAEVWATATAAPLSLGYASVPSALAKTGVNTGMLAVGLLLLAFGGLLTLVLRRKRS